MSPIQPVQNVTPQSVCTSAARRVRVSDGHFVYRGPVICADAEPKSTPAAPALDRCGAPDVVRSARSPFVEVQVSPAAPNWAINSRLRVHQARVGDRARWRSACGQHLGCAPNRLAREPGLESDPLLEQPRSGKYHRCDRQRSADARGPIDPHPPSASRWAPPSPAMRERGFEMLPVIPLARSAGKGAPGEAEGGCGSA